jgi:hypothetical protein
MTPHISGTSIDAQERYAKGTHDIIKRYLAGEEQEPANLIVINGDVSGSKVFLLTTVREQGVWTARHEAKRSKASRPVSGSFIAKHAAAVYTYHCPRELIVKTSSIPPRTLPMRPPDP